MANGFEGYNLPQGILTNFYRAVAARRPGVFSKVGLGTFVDPRIEGGRINERATASTRSTCRPGSLCRSITARSLPAVR
jgi:acyl CoA:acetate/3-ketoacid CoA transferase